MRVIDPTRRIVHGTEIHLGFWARFKVFLGAPVIYLSEIITENKPGNSACREQFVRVPPIFGKGLGSIKTNTYEISSFQLNSDSEVEER